MKTASLSLCSPTARHPPRSKRGGSPQRTQRAQRKEQGPVSEFGLLRWLHRMRAFCPTRRRKNSLCALCSLWLRRNLKFEPVSRPDRKPRRFALAARRSRPCRSKRGGSPQRTQRAQRKEQGPVSEFGLLCREFHPRHGVHTRNRLPALFGSRGRSPSRIVDRKLDVGGRTSP